MSVSRPVRIAAVVGVLMLLTSLAGCGLGKQYRTPETVGIVTAWSADHRTYTIKTEGGQLITIIDANYQVLESSTYPSAGDLLMLGSKPSPWVVAAYPRVPDKQDCFVLAGPLTVRSDSVEYEIGLRLPKAPSFQTSEASDVRLDALSCLDSQARVTGLTHVGA